MAFIFETVAAGGCTNLLSNVYLLIFLKEARRRSPEMSYLSLSRRPRDFQVDIIDILRVRDEFTC